MGYTPPRLYASPFRAGPGRRPAVGVPPDGDAGDGGRTGHHRRRLGTALRRHFGLANLQRPGPVPRHPPCAATSTSFFSQFLFSVFFWGGAFSRCSQLNAAPRALCDAFQLAPVFSDFFPYNLIVCPIHVFQVPAIVADRRNNACQMGASVSLTWVGFDHCSRISHLCTIRHVSCCVTCSD